MFWTDVLTTTVIVAHELSYMIDTCWCLFLNRCSKYLRVVVDSTRSSIWVLNCLLSWNVRKMSLFWPWKRLRTWMIEQSEVDRLGFRASDEQKQRKTEASKTYKHLSIRTGLRRKGKETNIRRKIHEERRSNQNNIQKQNHWNKSNTSGNPKKGGWDKEGPQAVHSKLQTNNVNESNIQNITGFDRRSQSTAKKQRSRSVVWDLQGLSITGLSYMFFSGILLEHIMTPPCSKCSIALRAHPVSWIFRTSY